MSKTAPTLTPDDPAAVFLVADTVIAYAGSAGSLEKWVLEHVEGKITQTEFAHKVLSEIGTGRMGWADESIAVELTGRTLGILIEFKVPYHPTASHRLCYAYCERFEARRI